MINETVVLSAHFCGPPGSGNGGITVGHVARAIRGAAQTTLLAPPPLGVPMQLSGNDHAVDLTVDEHPIATSRAHALDLEPLALESRPPLDYDAVHARQTDYAGFDAHSFPGCFVCGPDRPPTNGLRIFAAPYGDGVAAAWTPGAGLVGSDALIDPIYLHAALDCPSYFAFCDPKLVALLGRMHSEIYIRPQVGEPLVVEAWPLSRDGRKCRSAAIIRGHTGELVAAAVNTWIRIDGAIPGPPVPSASPQT